MALCTLEGNKVRAEVVLQRRTAPVTVTPRGHQCMWIHRRCILLPEVLSSDLLRPLARGRGAGG